MVREQDVPGDSNPSALGSWRCHPTKGVRRPNQPVRPFGAAPTFSPQALGALSALYPPKENHVTTAPSRKASIWRAFSGAIQRSTLAASICLGAIGFAGNASAQDAFWPITVPTTIASLQGGMVMGSQLKVVSAITCRQTAPKRASEPCTPASFQHAQI